MSKLEQAHIISVGTLFSMYDKDHSSKLEQAHEQTTNKGILTLVHDSASVPPATFVRYLPALQVVQTAASLPEKDPFWHCIDTICTLEETELALGGQFFMCIYICTLLLTKQPPVHANI